MSITFTGSINTAPSTLKDGVYDSTTDTILIVESTTPTIRKYNPNTLSFVASAACLSSPIGLCVLNSASAVVVSSSATTVDFVEIASLTRSNVAGGAAIYSAANKSGQLIAADTSLGIAFAVASLAANPIVKILAAGQAISKPTMNFNTNFIGHCIILKASGRWLVGGKLGKIYELDSSANIVDELTVQLTPNTGQLQNYNAAALSQPIITGLSYDNNMLLVTTDVGLFLYDYSTKTRLASLPLSSFDANGDQYLICASSSGETLFSVLTNAVTENTPIQELEFTAGPLQTKDVLFTNAVNKIVSMNFAASGQAMALQPTSEQIRIFNVIPRATTTRTVTAQISSVQQQARLIWIDDTGGVGTAKRLLDTFMQSPATYRIATGLNVIEIVMVGEGDDAVFAVSRFST